MKKFCVLFLLVCTLPAGAELISEVTYNPSRLGKYRVLKVAEEATLPGGLRIPANGSMTVASNASVAMRYQPTGTTAPATPSFVVRSVETAESTPQRQLGIASKVSVDMPNTTFMGVSGHIPGWNGDADWSIDSNTSPSSTFYNPIDSVVMHGGDVTAERADSFIYNLGSSTNDKIYVTTDKMMVNGMLSIGGVDPSEESQAIEYYTQVDLQHAYTVPPFESGLKGFKLHGVRIGRWSSSPILMLGVCRLAWVGRYALANANEPNSGPVKRCVLARVCGSASATPTDCQP